MLHVVAAEVMDTPAGRCILERTGFANGDFYPKHIPLVHTGLGRGLVFTSGLNSSFIQYQSTFKQVHHPSNPFKVLQGQSTIKQSIKKTKDNQFKSPDKIGQGKVKIYYPVLSPIDQHSIILKPFKPSKTNNTFFKPVQP